MCNSEWTCNLLSPFPVWTEFRPGITAAHPGVGTLGENDPVLHYKYYQWVAFMLFFQAMLFYAPRYIWKAWEGDRLKLLAHGMGKSDIRVAGSFCCTKVEQASQH